MINTAKRPPFVGLLTILIFNILFCYFYSTNNANAQRLSKYRGVELLADCTSNEPKNNLTCMAYIEGFTDGFSIFSFSEDMGRKLDQNNRVLYSEFSFHIQNS